ncbi:MAG: CaiB/BaiF CoA-transferase family protein [Kibdelosporangium sp.]
MSTGPLAGLRVVELAGIGPAPFCAMLLADLGADVVRVDRPSGSAVAGLPSRDLLNRNKRSVLVDLKNDRGPEVVLRLAAEADVLIEGYRPGVAERLGVGPEQCWERNSKLVYGRMTGWGQEGPLAQSAGHDIGYIGITGVLHAIGRADGPPQVPLNLVGDFGGGSLYLAVGILAALRTGKGQVVDAAIVDGAAHLATMIYGLVSAGVWRPERGANLLDTGAPFYDVYETSDGEHMAVGPLEPRFYAKFVELLGLADAGLPAQMDIPQWPVLRKRFAEVFATRSREEWTAVFEGTDACVAPVLSLTEASSHPHIVARGTLVDRDGFVQPAPAPRFSATPAELRTPPAIPGQHTREALADWGFDDIDELLAHGAVRE